MCASAAMLSFAVACTSSTAPSLPKLPDTTTAPPPNGVSLKASAPTLTSPAEGVEIIGSPTLQISGAQGLVAGQTFQYQFEISNSNGTVLDTAIVDGTTLIYTGVLPQSSTFQWRARASRDSQFFGPWSNARTFKTGALPGCINGRLTDPAAFFYWKINRTLGTGTNNADWQNALRASGFPAGYPPGVRPPVGPPFYGFSQQIDSSGNLRGRVFLPTDIPEHNGFYSRETNFLTNGCGALCWTWQEIGTSPYAPQTCP
jgi:hypothetical protein